MPLIVADQVSLAPYTTLQMGGPAQHLAQITDRATLVEALDWAKARALPITILGGGSNVVISDRGIPGVVLVMQTRGIVLTKQRDAVHATVEAGEPWDGFVERCVQEDLAGLECLSGIPGAVGATPIQNVGAYGQEVASCIEAVEVVDRSTSQIAWLGAEACNLGYRASRFKREPARFIVLAVRFALAPGAAPTLRYAELARSVAAGGELATLASVRQHVRALRRTKSMLLEPEDENRRSVGSFFLNPIVAAAQAADITARAQSLGLIATDDDLPRYPQPDGRQKLSAAWLIERSGTQRGERAGGVGISSRHALALVHHGGARSAELLAFAARVRERVRNTFGIELEQEPVMLGF